jgi:hypothetical protein
MSITRSRKKLRDPHQPLDPQALERGRQVAARYQCVIWFEDGEFYGRGLELPFTLEDGSTADECVRKLREAMAGTVALMIEMGDAVPTPLLDTVERSAQVNIRLSAAEKLVLEDAARANGFKGVSDYVRAKALSAA